MATWWDELLTRLFTPGIGGQYVMGSGSSAAFRGFNANTGSAVGRQAAPAFQGARDELNRQERAATGATPAPSPTPATTTNPNLRESEQATGAINTAIGGVQKTNPLYGAIPSGYAYMGSERKERGAKGSEKFVKEDRFASIQEVIASVNEWSEKKRQQFAELAVDAGLLKQVTTNYDDLEPILAQLAVRSAKLYERGVKATPWSLLEKYGKAGAIAGAGGPITTTTVNRSINLTSPREADALVDAALQQRLGRSPTEKEKKSFLEALNSSEKKEPSITKTTTTTTGSGTENVSSTSNTQTSGGVDVGAFAREWSLSHNKDEAGSFQALAQYMPAFFSALSAPV